MPLFQKSVQKKYINALDKFKVETAYQRLLTHFGNPVIQENIRRAKEEQYQEGFLNQLFVEILGYRMSPQPFFNLVTEQKNEKNSKKADGAILKNDKPIAVIELKSLKTVDLQSIELQAFSYKNNQSQCVYVMTSNFQKLRFYIENALDWEEFDLFDLSKERFQLLYLCLHAEHLLADLPLRIKKDSLEKETDITQKLYNDYAGFKKALFKDILSKDKSLNQLVLFKKTQKLLDRFLFIFFAEDKGLLPPNSVKEIVNQWNTLKDLDAYQPLYNRFKQYFGYLNHGHQTPNYSIFAYNGGLFAPDDFLDNLTISDGLLYNYTQLLSGYDFDTDVDTNILGHIFEHSLNETDEIAASATNVAIDKSKTKRKKDGIFYTPRYITKYIVENTVGALCQQKLVELGIDPNNMDIYADKETKNSVCKKIHVYRDWLLNLTILDPACGSGAFLNQALTFLMEEHQRIDAMFKSLYDVPITLTDNVLQILENNIFGVDINEESVEIARLSLWLRTAKIGRKLNDLSRNILCGNSLISDKNVAGDLAFDWQKAFPQVFEKGGFDVVIGNPPYVLCQPSNTDEKTLNYYKTFEVASYKVDLFHLFFEKAVNLTKLDGKIGFITPNTYLTNKYIQTLRNFIINNSFIENIVCYETGVFADAGVDVATIILTKSKMFNDKIMVFKVTNDIATLTTVKSQTAWAEDTEQTFNLNKTFDFNLNHCIPIENICSITFGLQTKDKTLYVAEKPMDSDWELCYTGKDVHRYGLATPTLFFKNNPDEVKAGGSWDMKVHKSKKIVVRQVGNPEPIFALDTLGVATLNTMYSIVLTDFNFDYRYLLAVLSSNLIKKYYLAKYSDNKDLFPKIKGYQLKQLPIKNIVLGKQQPFVDLADKMLTLHAQLRAAQTDFQNLLTDNFETLKWNKAIENWHQGDFAAFKKSLEKQKIEIPLKKQKEWRELFDSEKATYLSLQTQIENTDKEINNRVYTLYELTEAEIEIVENQ